VPIFLSKEKTGFAKHIIVRDDSVDLVDHAPSEGDYWHLDDHAYLSLRRVAEARSIDLKMTPDDARVAWWSNWTNTPRIDYVLPKNTAINHIRKLISTCNHVIDDQYFSGQYQIQNRLLDLMQPAHVDDKILSMQDQNIIESFGHIVEGCCEKIVYDNYSSSTGRMSVKSGPKILTMNKDHRHIFKSEYGNAGTLLSIDYSALEPRVIMTLMGQRGIPSDIYTTIGTQLHLTQIARKTIKLMILAILYGMSRKNFIVKFMTEQDPDIAYDKIRDLLGVKSINARIKDEMQSGVIRNHYGRPLRCDNEGLFVNHFTQSTAVDVACEGFLNVITENSNIAKPIFILHDELVVDVRNEDLQKINERIRDGIFISSLSTTFHVTTKVFNARKSD